MLCPLSKSIRTLSRKCPDELMSRRFTQAVNPFILVLIDIFVSGLNSAKIQSFLGVAFKYLLFSKEKFIEIITRGQMYEMESYPFSIQLASKQQ